MTLHRAIAKTAAETTLAEQFAALRGAAASPRREAAFRRFEEAGLPTRRVESWHYTDLRAALASAAPLAAAPDAAAIEAARRSLASLTRAGRTRLVLVDGRFVAALSDAPPAGRRRRSLSRPRRRRAPDADAMLALDVALTLGGCAIAVEPGAAGAAHRDRPLLFAGGAAAVYSRLAVALRVGARAGFIERFVGASPSAQRHHATWIDLAPGAKAHHVASIEDDAGLHVESLRSCVWRSAPNSTPSASSAGGALVRRQIFATLAGEQARIGLGGLALIDGRRHADTTLEVVHAARGGESREFFRHIVADDGDRRVSGQGRRQARRAEDRRRDEVPGDPAFRRRRR